MSKINFNLKFKKIYFIFFMNFQKKMIKKNFNLKFILTLLFFILFLNHSLYSIINTDNFGRIQKASYLNEDSYHIEIFFLTDCPCLY